MADGRKAEESVDLISGKLDDFRSAVKNLTAEEENDVDVHSTLNDVDDELMDLRRVVSNLDLIKPYSENLETRRQKLDDELNQLSIEISRHIDSYPTALQNPKPHPEGSSAQHGSLQDILSKVKIIKVICGKFCALLDDRRNEMPDTSSEAEDISWKDYELDALENEGEGSSLDINDKASVEGDYLVGFESQKDRLIQMLLEEDSGTRDVWVTGRRGSGKTALVRKVCEDGRVREHFGSIAWISAPQIYNPELNRREILLQLLLETKATVPDYLSALTMDIDMLEAEVINLLQKARYLIVVDNLVDQPTLEAFIRVRNIVGEAGQTIFIGRSTYLDGPKSITYQLKGLSEEKSWLLFRLKTFPEGGVPNLFMQFREDIVRACEGLPEAIILSGRLLCNLRERNDEWGSMLCHRLDLVQQVLKFIDDYNELGSCLLYLSIFPENRPISRMRVSRLWTAEGFLDLERAEDFLQELLDKKWIHPVETRGDGGFSTFQVDNLVREIIVSLSDHRNLLRITSEGNTNWPERVRYLSVHGGTVQNLNEEKLSQLRSLFTFNVSSKKDKTTMSEASPSETSENQLFPFNIKLLQVLDLTGAPLQIAPDVLFESTLLRYLRDTSIEVISRSIERLKHLEFLDLKQSMVTELPPEIAKLKNIRHILIYRYEKDPQMESYNLIGFKAPCTIRGFECLEKLCFVVSDSSTLEDLGYLTKLRRLGIVELREEHGKLLCSSLENLELLESLNLHAYDEDERIDLHHLSSAPVSLKRLYLHGRLNMLPNWISSLGHLTKIVLKWSHLEAATQQEEDFLATLGKLPKLVELELRRAYDGRQLDFKDGQFPKLKILLLDELGRLRSMSLAEGTMPCLEDLTISRCPWLERIPTGIEHIPTLQALEFFDMSREFYEMIPDDYRNSKGNPKVHLTQWRPGQWKTIPLVGIDEREEGFASDTE